MMKEWNNYKNITIITGYKYGTFLLMLTMDFEKSILYTEEKYMKVIRIK